MRSRKLLTVLFAALLVLAAIPVTARADTISGEYTYTETEGGVMIKGYSGTDSVITIPDTLDGAPVVAIGEEAFLNNINITSVTIQEGVKVIEDAAFCQCTNLTSVSLPTTLESIGRDCFSQTALVSIKIPKNTSSIGRYAFIHCPSLQEINVDDENTSFVIDGGALLDYAKTHLFQYPAAKTGTSYTIPNGVTSMENGAFWGSSLSSVIFPSSLKDISDSAFEGCTELETVTLAEGQLSIAPHAFKGCSKLKSINIPSSVDYIDMYAFRDCPNITDVTVSAGSSYYSSVNGVLFDNTGATLYYYPSGKQGAYTIPDGVTLIGDEAFFGSPITNVAFPASLDTIGTGSFMYCGNLSSVNLPAEIQTVGENAFTYCNSLTQAYFHGDKPEMYAPFVSDGSSFTIYYPVSHSASWSGYTDNPCKPYCMLTLNKQDGSVPVSSIAVITGGHINKPANPSRAGYSFVGWCKDAACSRPWDFSKDTVTSDITLYARWSTMAPNVNLSRITLSTGSLSKPFNPAVTSYTVNLGENDAAVTITPIKAFTGASMTIDRRAATSKTITVANGKTVTSKVVLKYGKMTKTYTLTIKRAKSTDNKLASLKASAGTFNVPFSPNVTSYILTLPEGTPKVTLKAVRNSSLEKLSPASKSLTLKNGQTVKVSIKVKAQSGATRVYTITVTRAKSTNAALSSLKTSLGKYPLIPAFTSGQTSYKVTLPANIPSIKISCKAADKLSNVTIDGVKLTSKTVSVVSGQSMTVKITVTAQMGNIRTYTILISRQ